MLAIFRPIYNNVSFLKSFECNKIISEVVVVTVTQLCVILSLFYRGVNNLLTDDSKRMKLYLYDEAI